MRTFKPAIIAIWLLAFGKLTAQPINLVRDINQNISTAGSSPASSSNYCVSGGVLYFPATGRSTGTELWKTDGTAAGTVLVADIIPGSSSSSPRNLTDLNGTLFFSASGTGIGIELWKSDGTPGGTVLVKDINPTGSSSPSNLTAINGILYFSATDGTNGIELWRSDGTEAGTYMVADILTGSGNSNPQLFTELNGFVYFVARNTGGTFAPFRLFRTNGTPGNLELLVSTSSSQLTRLGSSIIFATNDGVNGQELWKTDGTLAGTSLVRDINPGVSSSSPQSLLNVNGTLYFRATDPTNGDELWKSDGTTAGTLLVRNIAAGVSGSNVTPLIGIGNTVYFTANNILNGTELWRSDGTTAGTVLVKDINPGSGGSTFGTYSSIVNLNGILYFAADDGTSGFELWRSDGTNAGTFRLADVFPGSASGLSSGPLITYSNAVFFAGNDGVIGSELWRSGGTLATTAVLKDINGGTQDAFVLETIAISGGRVAFLSRECETCPFALWISDGTDQNTTKLEENVSPQQFTFFNNQIFFYKSDPATGIELWKSDGTPGTAQLVKDIQPGSLSSSVGSGNLFAFNNQLFFGPMLAQQALSFGKRTVLMPALSW